MTAAGRVQFNVFLRAPALAATLPPAMLDPAHSPPSPGKLEWVVFGFALLLLGLFSLELLVNYEPVKLSVLFVLLLWMPLVALHEAGHAVMAAVLGWRVCRVVIGFDRTLFTFRVRGVPVEIRLFPIQGFVQPAPKNLVLPRLKSTLIFAAGPGIEAALLALLVAGVGYDQLTTRTEEIPLILAQSLALAILLGLFFTLLPITVPTSGGASWSDGLGILLSWTLPDSYFEQARALPFLLEAEQQMQRGKPAEACQACREGLREHPRHLPLSLQLAELLLQTGQPHEARQVLDELLAGNQLDEAQRAAVELLRAQAVRESVWGAKPPA